MVPFAVDYPSLPVVSVLSTRETDAHLGICDIVPVASNVKIRKSSRSQLFSCNGSFSSEPARRLIDFYSESLP
jgi:hypothetical protein